MVAPFDRAAYILLRAHILSTWHYISLIDSIGREVTRIDYITDPRCAVQQNAATGEIAITVRIRGDDTDIAPRIPLRIIGSRLYAAASGGEPLHPSSIDPASLAAADDGLIYSHHLYVPLYHDDSTDV